MSAHHAGLGFRVSQSPVVRANFGLIARTTSAVALVPPQYHPGAKPLGFRRMKGRAAVQKNSVSRCQIQNLRPDVALARIPISRKLAIPGSLRERPGASGKPPGASGSVRGASGSFRERLGSLREPPGASGRLPGASRGVRGASGSVWEASGSLRERPKSFGRIQKWRKCYVLKHL